MYNPRPEEHHERLLGIARDDSPVTVWINGLKACHFNGETCTLPAYDRDRVFGILGRSGSIALQVHGGKSWPKGSKCRWKNIRIKDL